MKRSVLAVALLVTLCVSASAATAQRSKRPEGQARPSQRVSEPTRFAVPGWSDQATQRWMNNASSARF